MKSNIKQIIQFPAAVLKPIKDYLTSEEKRLKTKKEDLKKEDPFMDEDRSDDNTLDSDVAELVGHERVQAIRLEVDKGLINIRKALTRIKLGKYGICANCGKMIDTDRLAVNPTAEFCMECEEKRETGGRK